MAADVPRLADGAPPAQLSQLSSHRLSLVDGLQTTLHVAEYDAAEFAVEVALLAPPMALEQWCRSAGLQEALVGGFFIRAGGVPLGEVRQAGTRMASVPFRAPWDGIRACAFVHEGTLRVARRDRLPDGPISDLIQAGPLLLEAGELALDGDSEGFSVAAEQFDSDITVGRYPRAALALAGDRILAVASEGRNAREAGFTLHELAEALRDLGATDAINLDGGGSASLVCGGRLRNRPREGDGSLIHGGRAVSTALVFRRRD